MSLLDMDCQAWQEELARDRERIRAKPALRRLYAETYEKYRRCLERCPAQGVALELGAGAGFAREYIPELVCSDVFWHRDVAVVGDATRLPFADNSLRALFMLNTFHHIPDAAAFLREAERCLHPQGRVLICDQHVGWLSYWILKYAHNEAFDHRALEWRFARDNPLSTANGALAWIVFQRDRARFECEFPGLELLAYTPHTPLRYWLAGGLKNWSLLPGTLFPLFTWLDTILAHWLSQTGSFVDIELRKR